MKYYTVKEFAEKVSMSRQAVYNQLDKKLTPYIKEGEGKVLIGEKALELFEKSQALDREVDSTLDKTDNYFVKLIDSLDRTVDTLEKTIESLHEQLETLQKQLEVKDKEIESLYRILDQEQQLHAHSQKELLTIESRVVEIEQKQKNRKKWFGKNKE